MKMRQLFYEWKGGERHKPLSSCLSKGFKRSLGFLLTLILIISLIPSTVFAADIYDCTIKLGMSGITVTDGYSIKEITTPNDLIINCSTSTSASVDAQVSKTYFLSISASSTFWANSDTGKNITVWHNHPLAGGKGAVAATTNGGTFKSDVANFINNYSVTVQNLTGKGYSANEFVTAEGATYYYAFIRTDAGNNDLRYALLVEVTPVTISIDALSTALTGAPSIEQTGESYTDTVYYHTDDSYNGKTTVNSLITTLQANDTIKADSDTLKVLNTSYTSFWALYEAAMTRVNAIYPETAGTRTLADGVTQKQVDASAALLQAAIDNLIPTTQVNATELYEKLLRLEKTDTGYNYVPDRNSLTHYKQADYPAARWSAFETALTDVQALLDGLYNADGTASDRNWGPDRAGDPPADAITNEGITEALETLYTAQDRLISNTTLSVADAARTAMGKLDQMFPATEQSSYTSESWAAFTAAREEANRVREQFPSTSSFVTKTDAGTFSKAKRDYYAACYGLTESGDITVHVTVNDNLGAVYPNCALKDSGTATFSGSVTLSGGSHSFADLRSKFDWTADASGNADISPLRMIYINGLVVTDTENTVPYGTASLNSTSLQLRDGDQVTILRVLAPVGSYYGWSTYATISEFKDYLGVLRFTTDGASVTAGEGESFRVNVVGSAGYFDSYSGVERPSSGKEIVAYGPRNSDGSYPTTPICTGAFTDSSGNADVTLYAAGTYVLTAVDTAAMEKGSKYPNLTGGAHLEVTISGLEGSEAEKALQAQQAELDALFAQCNRDAMNLSVTYYDLAQKDWITMNPYTEASGAYAEATAAIENAASLLEARNAVEQASKVIENALQRAEYANNDAVSTYRYLANQLPNLEEINAGKVISGDMERFEEILLNRYYALTDYQRENLLTGSEQAQYEALADLYAKYSQGEIQLEERNTYSIRMEYVGLQPDDMSNPVILGREMDVNGQWPIYFQNDARTEDVVPGTSFWAFTRTADGTSVKAQEYELYDIQIEGADGYSYIEWDYYTAPHNQLGKQLWLEHRWAISRMPHNDVTIKLYVRSLTDDLDGVKSAATTELNKAYQGYVKSNYSTANWSTLTGAYQNGLSQIQNAVDKDSVESAKSAAIAAMAAVETLKQSSSSLPTVGDYGTVHIIMENTTCPDLPFYGEAGILETDVALNEDDTMMTVILAALQSEGFEWTGTGGSKGNKNDMTITYLASISKDGKTLGEFSGSSGSGWMGTLNDWFTNEGFQSFSVTASNRNYRLADGDKIRVMFTDDLGVDLGGGFGNPDTSLKSLEVNGGKLSPAFAGGTISYVLTPTGGSISLNPTATNKNYQVRIYLNETTGENWYRSGEAIPAKVGDTINIGVGDRAWPSMNNQTSDAISYTGTWYTITVSDSSSADSVIALIKDISTVTYSNYKTQAEKAALARTAYDGLTTEAKANVTNYAKLTEAEAAIKKFQEIDNVKALLAALPDSSKATDAQVKAAKSAIEAADRAYKALSDEQKGYITVGDSKNYNALVERLAKLTSTSASTITKDPNEEAASEVISLIEAIGTVTKDSGSKITAARKAYNALTDAQKKLVSNYSVLTEAEAAFAKLNSDLPFTDVKESDYYYDAVAWALEKGITNGTTDTTFSPNASCTRAQMVTFLWRAAGSPEPSGKASSFTDVNEDAYYFKALLWAIENGITNGTSTTTFSPDMTCTRGQMAAFLYRSAKTPAVSGNASFTDVTDGDYFSDAVVWAAQEGITNGTTATTFSPYSDCTRGQMVTFLYRYLAD